MEATDRVGDGRGYDIFPRTLGARALLALAFVAGLGLTAVPVVLFTIAAFSGLLNETSVVVVNATGSRVTFYVGDIEQATLEPNETYVHKDIRLAWRWDRLVYAESGGWPIFADQLDEDDLERLDYRIIIQDPPCVGPRLDECLGAQTSLGPLADRTCEGDERRVCLAPLGAVSPALVQQLVDHYREEYDVPITVLTPNAVPRSLVDPVREQIDATALTEHMGGLFPEAYADPEIVLIGLTPADMYGTDVDWRFKFGQRGTFADPKAVVSTFRMDPLSFGAAQDDELMYSRARKMVTRYIGELYFDLPNNEDPKSLLYDNILSVDDLDHMEEPLRVANR